MMPVMLDLQAQPVLVVGGGTIAARKIKSLLVADAHITVVATVLNAQISAHVQAERITAHVQPYDESILEVVRPVLVFAATDDEQVNAWVTQHCRQRRIWVNRADDAHDSTLHNLPHRQRQHLMLAVSSGGTSPALATHLLDVLDAAIGPEYDTLAGWLAALRPYIKAHINDANQRRDVWHALIASDALHHLRDGQLESARQIIAHHLANHIEANEAHKVSDIWQALL